MRAQATGAATSSASALASCSDGRARQALHLEGIEGVSGGGDELRLGALGSPREGHLGSGAHELLGDGQRRHHMAGGAAGRNQHPGHIARRRRARTAPAWAGRAAAWGRAAARRRAAGLRDFLRAGSGATSGCAP